MKTCAAAKNKFRKSRSLRRGQLEAFLFFLFFLSYIFCQVFSEDRGIRFWRRCAAEPHCIRLLPENQPRTRNEAILRRVVNPGDLRSYFDHKGRFMYPTRPVAMEMDAIRERRREGLQMVRRHTEILKVRWRIDQTERHTCIYM